ncbi:MAG: gliding motility-associated C-terminal domain-containing protein [Saprospiraceae bacterium]|nr:gliding motility-associated C-terminal domain-containing protein [Saprospiraceae bacterium]
MFDANGCSATANKEVVVNAKPDAGPDVELDCYKFNEVILTKDKEGDWSFGKTDGSAKIEKKSDGSTVVSNFTSPGLYELVLLNKGCSDTLSLNVKNECACKIENNSIIKPVPSVFCEEVSDVLIEGEDATPVEGVYLWQHSFDKEEFKEAIGNNKSKNYTTGLLNMGLHRFRRLFSTLLPVSCNDTSNIVSIKITRSLESPFMSGETPKPICLGDTINLKVNGLPGALFTWKSSSDHSGLHNTTGPGQNYLIPTAPGSYMVTVTQVVETCKIDSDPLEIEVRVNKLPAINIGSDSTICELDGDVNIYAEGEFNSIDWSDGSTGDKMIINNKGTYSVTVTNDEGCESSDEVVIKNFCCKIFHPNIINLSSTSGNNVFQIKETSCVISSKISIYDRWGNLVYKSNNGLDQWDGTWNGKPVELGVYVFIFTYKALDEDENVFEDVVTGDVTVIR